MADGIGCQCGAYGECECGCPDVDWTPQELIDARGQIKYLKNLLEEVRYETQQYSEGFQLLWEEVGIALGESNGNV